jgi:hypothetical protein
MLDQLAGSFLVTLQAERPPMPALTKVFGKVKNGVDPEQVPLMQTAAEGDCELLEPAAGLRRLGGNRGPGSARAVAGA